VSPGQVFKSKAGEDFRIISVTSGEYCIIALNIKTNELKSFNINGQKIKNVNSEEDLVL